MVECTKCSNTLNSDDLFCGECGQKVVVQTREPSPPKERPKPQVPPSPLAAKPELTAKQLLIFVTGAAAVLFVVYIFSDKASRSYPSGSVVSVSRPLEEFSRRKPSNNRQNGTRMDARTQAQYGARVAAQIKSSRYLYQSNGIAKIARYKLTIASCANCLPLMIYCRSPLARVQDLRGRKVRVFSPAAVNLVRKFGGSPQRLAFAEVRVALELGVIDCSITGGAKPL